MYRQKRRRPPTVLLFALLLGLGALIWGGWGVYEGISLQDEPAPAAANRIEPTPATAPSAAEIITLVQGYNQADVLANEASDVRYLLPYIHPNGPLYQHLSREYRRRIAEGEIHHVTLTRFWASEPEISKTAATLETKEIWDETVISSQSGEVISAQIGIETHQRYTLQPDAGGVWRIWELEMVVAGEYTP